MSMLAETNPAVNNFFKKRTEPLKMALFSNFKSLCD